MGANKADAVASFAVDLEDGTAGPARSAGDALRQLRGQLDADTKALQAMNTAMRNLKGGNAAQIAQAKELASKMKVQKAAIAQTTSSILALGGSLEKTGGKKGITSLLEQLKKGSSEVGGPMAQLIGRISSLKDVLAGGVIALGLVAVAAAIVAVTAATVAAIAVLLKYGVAQADARRNEGLRLEGLTKLRNWYGIAAGNAGEMQAAIDKASLSTAVGRDDLAKYTEQLYKMHLRGQNLTDTLEAMAIKAQVQGEAQAMRFAGMAAGAAFAGKSVKKLADDVKARLGGIAARQMLALDVQTKKFHESLSRLFSDLKIEGLLRGMQTLTQLFSQNTATGRALKVIVERMLQPLIDAATVAGPIVKRFFQGMVIATLILVITFLKLRNAFRDAFGDSQALEGIDMANLALHAGILAVALLAGGVAALVTVFAVLASPIIAAGLALYQFYSIAKNVYKLWSDIDWSTLGSSIVDGIVNGLKSGAKWVLDAMRNLGSLAMNALKGKLDIHSPSRVFARLGRQIPMGVSAGVDAGAPAVDRSVSRVVDVPRYLDIPSTSSTPTAPLSSPAAAAAPSGGKVEIHELHFHTSSDKPREQVRDFMRELESALEGLAVRMGAPVPGGA